MSAFGNKLAPNSLTGVQSIKDIIDGEGLGANLITCLDAGVSASFDNGAKFLDLTSNGYDFFLGSDGAGGDDPTFNGTVNAASNAEFFDTFSTGGAGFRYDTTNPADFDAFHQNNAAFTFMAIFRFVSPGGNNVALCGSQGATGGNAGIRWSFLGSNAPTFNVGNGSGFVFDSLAGTALTTNTDYILFLSYDEAGGAGFQRANKSTIHTLSGGYASPAAGSALYTMELMKPGNNELNSWADTARLYAFGMWNTSLSTANCDTIHDAINAARSYV